MQRIITYKEIKNIIEESKSFRKKIVLVGGCFDILHYGHIKFLRNAKSFGDLLIVALENDVNVRRLKGSNRPFQKQKERAETLAELKSVDYVLMLPEMSGDKDYERLVDILTPDLIAVTEGDNYLLQKNKYAEKVGARLKIIKKIKSSSSSKLANLLGLD